MTTSESPQVDAAKQAVARGYAAVADGWRRWRKQFAVAGRPATEELLRGAAVAEGMQVLDLAGGAGEPGLTLAAIVGPAGHVTITDLVPEMLAVAEEETRARAVTNVTLRPADAEALPFDDRSFDRVTCRFAAMHFPHTEVALAETLRVLKPGGRAAFSVLGPPQFTPSFITTVGVIMQYVQVPPPAEDFPGPYRLAEPEALARMFVAAGFANVTETRAVVPSPWPGTAEDVWQALPQHAPGARDLLALLDRDQAEAVKEEALAAIRRYADGGMINFTQPMIVVTGERAG